MFVNSRVYISAIDIYSRLLLEYFISLKLLIFPLLFSIFFIITTLLFFAKKTIIVRKI